MITAALDHLKLCILESNKEDVYKYKLIFPAFQHSRVIFSFITTLLGSLHIHILSVFEATYYTAILQCNKLGGF